MDDNWDIYVQVRDNQKVIPNEIIFNGLLGQCFGFLDSIKDQTISGVIVDELKTKTKFFTIVNEKLRFQNTPFRDTNYLLNSE